MPYYFLLNVGVGGAEERPTNDPDLVEMVLAALDDEDSKRCLSLI
jgi:hypothetical protein